MKSKIMPLILLITAISVLNIHSTFSDELKVGTIKGQVLDTETKAPLPGVSVFIANTKNGAKTNVDGYFSIKNLPVGNYTAKFNVIGYKPLSKTDIIVRSKRITFLEAELKVSVVETQDIVVSSGYFSQVEDQPTSTINYSAEEIRRAPGSAGDVCRIISALPSIAKTNDQMNSLVVRGGSSAENSFFIDNIEIPNINHYPVQGATGGPISLLNVDFIQGVNFSSGGFSAAYGDRLSSIMELSFREGNRDEFDGQLDFGFAGLGATVEGPFSNKGTWMLSVRRSYLDLLVDAIGTGVAPRYSDYQGKLSYNLSSSDKITVLEILGIDYINFKKDKSFEEGRSNYGSFDAVENTFGINWRHIWGKNGYSNTAISHSFTKYKTDMLKTTTDLPLNKGESLEQIYNIRNVNHYRFNKSNRLEFGFNSKHLSINNDTFTGEYINLFGDTIPSISQDEETNGQKYGVFVNYISKPLKNLTATLGVRADYFSLNENSHISPRFALSYQITDKTSINGSTGIYYQNLPLVLLSKQEDYAKLKDLAAYHYILGVNHLLNDNTRLTVEIYDKEYDNFPLDPAQPQLFIVDELAYNRFYSSHDSLHDIGKAYSRGIEMIIQKKLAEDFYGLISGSYSKTKYRDYDGIWRDRVYDNRYIFSAEGGYKPSNKWEFSLRWVYAGGVPYTPFDMTTSTQRNRGIIDQTKINESRYSDYHSLNIRFDRRFHFGGSNLICYFSVWNAYNRKNVSQYYWNEIDNKQDVMYQWSILPIGGFEYEF